MPAAGRADASAARWSSPIPANPAVRKHKDYSGVVLWLEPVGPRAPPARRPKHVQMKQKDKRFMPHVLAIPVGSTVDFPNLDPIFHNAFSNFSGQPFDVGLYPPGTSQERGCSGPPASCGSSATSTPP